MTPLECMRWSGQTKNKKALARPPRGVRENMHKISAGRSCGMTTSRTRRRRTHSLDESWATVAPAAHPLCSKCSPEKGRQDTGRRKKRRFRPAIPTEQNKLGRNKHVLGPKSLLHAGAIIDDIHIRASLRPLSHSERDLTRCSEDYRAGDDYGLSDTALMTRFVIEAIGKKCVTRNVRDLTNPRPPSDRWCSDIPVSSTALSFGVRLSIRAEIARARGPL